MVLVHGKVPKVQSNALVELKGKDTIEEVMRE
jgi:hypothetical protein